MNGPNLVDHHFNRIASHWHQKYSTNGSMLPRIRLFTTAVFERCGRDASVLDFGCGSGDLAAALHSQGFRVLGVDAAEEMVRQARRQLGSLGVEVLYLPQGGDSLDEGLGTRLFDAVVLSSVLEYVAQAARLLGQLVSVTGDGAWLFATVPNSRHPVRWAERCIAAYDRMRRAPPDTLSPYREYLQVSVTRPPVAGWIRLFGQSGWEVVEVRGKTSPLLLLIARRTAAP